MSPRIRTFTTPTVSEIKPPRQRALVIASLLARP